MNYQEVVIPQSARIGKTGLDSRTRAARSGITLSYQPSLLVHPCPDKSLRPVEYYQPDFQEPSRALRLALESGQPYASGVSGTTNLILHLACYLKRRKTLDMRHLWMSVMLFVVNDGGHSIHETLWVANQLDSMLGLDLGMEGSADPLNYIGSTAQLERLFAATASAPLIANAKRYAWRHTLDAFRRYSYYAHP